MSKETPWVSVILPTHNRCSYLKEALESVLAQNFRSLEILVVDDGSTDGTAGMMDHFKGSVRYVWQPNQGVSVARNLGVVLARNEFLAFLDSDDLWVPEKLSLQTSVLLAQPEAEAVFGCARQFYSPDLPEEMQVRFRRHEEVFSSVDVSALLIRKSSFLRVGFFEAHLRTAEFMSWMIRSREAGLRLAHLDQCVCLRRIHAANKGITRRGNVSPRIALIRAALDRRRLEPAEGRKVRE